MAMAYEAIAAFLKDLREREAGAALALEFTILTAARTGEGLGATWDKVDLAKGVWTVPAERMKVGKEHRVPLCDRAVAILRSCQVLGSKRVFVGPKSDKLSGMAMSMLLRRMKQDDTVHGLGSAFRDWAAERTSCANEVCEMALAHAIANKSEEAYRRGDLFEKRQRLMTDWAGFRASLAAALGHGSDGQLSPR